MQKADKNWWGAWVGNALEGGCTIFIVAFICLIIMMRQNLWAGGQVGERVGVPWLFFARGTPSHRKSGMGPAYLEYG